MSGFRKTISTVSIAIFSIISLLVPSHAFAVGHVTPATGGEAISIDTTSAGSTPEWTKLSGLTIQENSVGEISAGVHVITLPAGWEFNTAGNITVSGDSASELTLQWINLRPDTTSNTFTFRVTQVSVTNPGYLNFDGDFYVRPTGTTAPSSVNLTHSGAPIVGVIDGGLPGATNFGTISAVQGEARKVKVVTLADESIPAQPITADESLIGYSIRTDQFDNFIDNAASTWSLVAPVGVVNGDLVPAEDNKSATLVGNLVGTATIRVVIDGLDSDSCSTN